MRGSRLYSSFSAFKSLTGIVAVLFGAGVAEQGVTSSFGGVFTRNTVQICTMVGLARNWTPWRLRLPTCAAVRGQT
jgi:hypothetical protein